MAEIVLEFEKPIAELEAKLAEWESLSSSNNMSVDDELNALKRKIEETCSKHKRSYKNCMMRRVT